jgi:GDP-L-fucose synthase
MRFIELKEGLLCLIRKEFIIFLLQNNNEQGLVNIGCGTDVCIKELAELIVIEVGYEGQLMFDKTKPNGTPRKLMDTSRINNLGWSAKLDL